MESANNDQASNSQKHSELPEEEKEQTPFKVENAVEPEVSEKNSQLENALFSQKFYCKGAKGVGEHTVSITPNYLMVDNQKSSNILLSNIIGATVNKVPSAEKGRINSKWTYSKEDLYSLTVHVFTKYTPWSLFGSKEPRRYMYEINYYTNEKQVADTWRNLIIQAANNPKFRENLHKYETAEEVPVFKKILLVFINPASGAKLAPARWVQAKVFLNKAGCEYIEVNTEYSGHARDYVEKLDLEELLKLDGIISVSGDGLPHEIINGLCRRPDYDQLKHLPLGPLPGGSGNAIVKNVCDRAGEYNSLMEACHLIAKGKTTKCDLMVVEVPGKPLVYSFLSFIWGTVAHIDIESEAVRFLGGFRFDLYGLLAVIKMKKFKGKLSYSTTDNALYPFDQEITDDKWVHLNEDFSYFNIHRMAYITANDYAAPITDFNDGHNHLLTLKGNSHGRVTMTKTLLGLGGGLFKSEEKIKKTGIFYEKIKSFRIEAQNNPGNYFSIDGEKYDSTIAQGKLSEHGFTLFCTK